MLGNWLILADFGAGEALARQIDQLGSRCTILRTGERNAQQSERHFIAQPEQTAEFRDLLNSW
jgi:hypothetical protein